MQFEQEAKCGRSNWSGERFQTRTWVVSIASLLAVVVARMAHPCDCTSLSCILVRLLARARALRATCRFAIRTTWLRSSMHARKTTCCIKHADVRPSAIAVVRASIAWPCRYLTCMHDKSTSSPRVLVVSFHVDDVVCICQAWCGRRPFPSPCRNVGVARRRLTFAS